MVKVGQMLWDEDGYLGQVVADIDTSQYSHQFPADQWSYLGRGVLLEFEDIGLVHYASYKLKGSTIYFQQEAKGL